MRNSTQHSRILVNLNYLRWVWKPQCLLSYSCYVGSHEFVNCLIREQWRLQNIVRHFYFTIINLTPRQIFGFNLRLIFRVARFWSSTWRSRTWRDSPKQWRSLTRSRGWTRGSQPSSFASKRRWTTVLTCAKRLLLARLLSQLFRCFGASGGKILSALTSDIVDRSMMQLLG